MVIPETLSFTLGDVSNCTARSVLLQLGSVIRCFELCSNGDIVPSIIIQQKQFTGVPEIYQSPKSNKYQILFNFVIAMRIGSYYIWFANISSYLHHLHYM